MWVPRIIALPLCVTALVAMTGPAGAADARLPTPPREWKLEVVAAAPAVRHPSVVCCAPDGRVFVAEDPMDIRLPEASAARGRIVCIHPGGRITTFAENLYAVFGMQYLDGKLYVLHNPKFTVFADGGDAGKDRRDLIESTNPNPWALNWNDHVPANFKLAMDGYFYVAVGDKGVYGAVGTDGRRVDLHGGGILRLRPDGSGLEVYCTGVRNILDVAMNDEDEIFTYDNTDEHGWMGRLTHMVDGGFYGYPYDFVPRRPYTLWMMADYGAGAATGAECYTQDALPPEYRGDLFLADFGKRNVLRVKVERDGATYKAVSRQDLFADAPADFRPVGIAFSPDGLSLYVCDWQHVDTKEDVEVGRLLKLTYTGKSHATPKPEWYVAAATGRPFEASTAELIAALSHPSRDVRMVAQRRLADRGNAAVEPLTKLLVSARAPAAAVVHGLWALDAIDGDARPREEVMFLTEDKDPRLRRQAMRLLATRRHPEGLRRTDDDDASVRFHAAAACGRIAERLPVDLLWPTLADPDAHVRYAGFTALNRVGRADPKAWAKIAAGLSSEVAEEREGAALAMRETYDATLVEAVARVAADAAAPPAARAAAVRVLGPLHRELPQWKGEWWAYHPALSAPPRKTAEWEGTAAVLAALRRGLDDSDEAVVLAALEGLHGAGDAAAAEEIRRVAGREGAGAALRRAAVRALATCDDGESVPFLVGQLGAAAGDESHVVQVLETLGRLRARGAVDVVKEKAASTPKLTAAAMEALVRIGGADGSAAIGELMGHARADVRRAAVRAAGELGDRALVPRLLAAHGDGDTQDYATTALARMPDARAAEIYIDGLISPDFACREKCRSALREVRDAALPAVEAALRKPLGDDAVLELQQIYRDHARAKQGPLFRVSINRRHPGEYVEFAVNQTGDVKVGQKLFGAAGDGGLGCVVCHAVGGAGGTVGPDLSGVGAKYSRRDLAEAVVYPSKAVREGYQQVVVRTKNSQTFSGPLKAETPEELTLHEADGTLRTVRKADVAARKDSGLSPMPEGLHAGLTLEQFAGLVSYLESLKSEAPPPKTKEPNR